MCVSGVSSMIAARRSGYFSSRCTGLMRSEERSQACVREEAADWVCAR